MVEKFIGRDSVEYCDMLVSSGQTVIPLPRFISYEQTYLSATEILGAYIKNTCSECMDGARRLIYFNFLEIYQDR